VESAIARPYLGYDRPIYRKAAALLQSVAGNHGFVDGNKRTAVILVELLLARSGYELIGIPPEDIQIALEAVVLNTVQHNLSLEELRLWFRARIVPKQLA
jgi:death on curing protein